jgi:hypothetical protein
MTVFQYHGIVSAMRDSRKGECCGREGGCRVFVEAGYSIWHVRVPLPLNKEVKILSKWIEVAAGVEGGCK